MVAENKIKFSSGHLIISGSPMQTWETYIKQNFPYSLLNLLLLLHTLSINGTTYFLLSIKTWVPSHTIAIIIY